MLRNLALALTTSAAVAAGSAGAETLNTASGPIDVETLASLDNPWGMDFLPDGRLIVTEKPGNVRIFADGQLSDPLKGAPTVAYLGQGGLLDVAVDPAFSENGFIYLSYAEPDPATAPEDPWDQRLGPQEQADNMLKGGAVARAKLVGDELTDLTVIWRQDPKEIGRGHFGGRIIFAPDGKMLITSGDRQRFDPAQDLGSTVGKIIRINADGTIPSDNPFIGREGAKGEIYSLGHRNPLGIAIHPESGAIWINEMGPKGGDELNLIAPGQNYGWPVVSNGVNYDDSDIPDHATKPEYVAPVVSWTPVISPSGMAFYKGSLFQDWKGNILIGGLSSQALIRLTVENDAVTAEERIAMNTRIRDVIEAPDGSVLVLTDGDAGELRKLTPGKASQ